MLLWRESWMIDKGGQTRGRWWSRVESSTIKRPRRLLAFAVGLPQLRLLVRCSFQVKNIDSRQAAYPHYNDPCNIRYSIKRQIVTAFAEALMRSLPHAEDLGTRRPKGHDKRIRHLVRCGLRLTRVCLPDMSERCMGVDTYLDRMANGARNIFVIH
ncbi:hypothetical protein BD310DRAFT_261831 [Dichomitus squalens]|uniref:Uncharacterized protein n=1 Tax=Dichomitus squalens TaxID=114155 RepID=A0A4Q9PBK4_9APHY|nr:hypothetical protein BD310DRAFT_261831 [Dichomitus squalens]